MSSRLLKRVLVLGLLALAVSMILPSSAVAKTRTKLSIKVSSAYEHFDSDPTITGVLKTASGKRLKKKVVKLYCGPIRIASKRTNSRGVVKFRASLPGSLMSGWWKLKYSGSSKYKRATSASKKTQIHVHYDGWLPLIGTDSGDQGETVYYFGMTRWLEGQRTYAFELSEPADAAIGPQESENPIFTTSYSQAFVFSTPYASNYTCAFATDSSMGGTGSLNLLVW